MTGGTFEKLCCAEAELAESEKVPLKLLPLKCRMPA